jgi:hypothetical protein
VGPPIITPFRTWHVGGAEAGSGGAADDDKVDLDSNDGGDEITGGAANPVPTVIARHPAATKPHGRRAEFMSNSVGKKPLIAHQALREYAGDAPMRGGHHTFNVLAATALQPEQPAARVLARWQCTSYILLSMQTGSGPAKIAALLNMKS